MDAMHNIHYHLKHSFQRGFTLMELVVVMAIIGVLTTIVAGSFTQTSMKSRDTRRKNDIAQLQRSLEAYYNDYQRYPASSGSAIQGYAWGGTFTDPNGTVYMNQLPYDPKAPNIQYRYVVNTEGTKYQIMTRLENTLDTQITADVNVTGKLCGTGTNYCNYAVSSQNTTVEEVLQ